MGLRGRRFPIVYPSPHMHTHHASSSGSHSLSHADHNTSHCYTIPNTSSPQVCTHAVHMVESAHNYNTRYCNVMNVYTNKMYSVYEIESSILTKTTVYIQCIYICVLYIYLRTRYHPGNRWFCRNSQGKCVHPGQILTIDSYIHIRTYPS